MIQLDSFETPEKDIERLKNITHLYDALIRLDLTRKSIWLGIKAVVGEMDMESVLEIVRFLTFPCTPVFI